tara:strand:- start:559 stop:1140 length:582 start_codon:yes stop_codon:yes gene_type:complete
MGGNYITQAVLYLIEVVFDLYILAVLLRYLLARVRADFYNPLSQFLVKVTNLPIKSLRRLTPSLFGIDWSSIILLFFLQGLKIIILTLITSGHIPVVSGLFVLTIANLLKIVIYVHMFIIIIQVVISWINPGAHNPITIIMHQLSEPILNSVRRLIPTAGGFDFSSMVAIITMEIMIILLVSPLMDLGVRLSY